MATREELESRDDIRAALDALRGRADIGTGKLCPIDTVFGPVIVKKPSRGQAAVMMTQIHDEDPGVVSKAMIGLFQMCVVWPDRAAVDAGLDEFPLAFTELTAMREFRVWVGNARSASAK